MRWPSAGWHPPRATRALSAETMGLSPFNRNSRRGASAGAGSWPSCSSTWTARSKSWSRAGEKPQSRVRQNGADGRARPPCMRWMVRARSSRAWTMSARSAICRFSQGGRAAPVPRDDALVEDVGVCVQRLVCRVLVGRGCRRPDRDAPPELLPRRAARLEIGVEPDRGLRLEELGDGVQLGRGCLESVLHLLVELGLRGHGQLCSRRFERTEEGVELLGREEGLGVIDGMRRRRHAGSRGRSHRGSRAARADRAAKEGRARLAPRPGDEAPRNAAGLPLASAVEAPISGDRPLVGRCLGGPTAEDRLDGGEVLAQLTRCRRRAGRRRSGPGEDLVGRCTCTGEAPRPASLPTRTRRRAPASIQRRRRPASPMGSMSASATRTDSSCARSIRRSAASSRNSGASGRPVRPDERWGSRIEPVPVRIGP